MNAQDTLFTFRRLALSIVPLVLIVAVAMGNAMLCSLAILPEWRTHTQLMNRVETDQQAAESVVGAQASKTGASVLQAQIDSAQAALLDSASLFLTQTQADDLVGTLYTYAAASRVQILNIQSQQTRPDRGERTPTTADSRPYDVRVFRLDAAGALPQLMNFVSHLREAALPSVTIANLAIQTDRGQTHLTMDFLLYTSPYASGKAFDALPTVVAAAPTAEPATLTPGEPVVAETSVAPAPLTPTAAATAIDLCSGAPPTLFHIGDTAIVHFKGVGALRILPEVSRNAVSALGQVYNGDQLHILAGPVCGQWKQSNILYWYVETKNLRGWAGEAAPNERWLCPASDPKCS